MWALKTRLKLYKTPEFLHHRTTSPDPFFISPVYLLGWKTLIPSTTGRHPLMWTLQLVGTVFTCSGLFPSLTMLLCPYLQLCSALSFTSLLLRFARSLCQVKLYFKHRHKFLMTDQLLDTGRPGTAPEYWPPAACDSPGSLTGEDVLQEGCSFSQPRGQPNPVAISICILRLAARCFLVAVFFPLCAQRSLDDDHVIVVKSTGDPLSSFILIKFLNFILQSMHSSPPTLSFALPCLPPINPTIHSSQ